MALWVPHGQTKPYGPGYGRWKVSPLPESHPSVLPCRSATLTLLFSNIPRLSCLESPDLPIWFGLGYFGCQELKLILDGLDDLRKSNKMKVPELRKSWPPEAAGSASHLSFEGR